MAFDHETSSALPRIAVCPPSAALPSSREHNDSAVWGSAKHDHMHDRARLGVDDAMEHLPLVLAKWGLDERSARIIQAQMRKFEWCPPAQSFGEVSLAICADGTVERTTGGRGKYPELEPGGRLFGKAILAGQLDIMWSEPEPLDLSDPLHPKCPPGSVLWVGDYKTGDDANVEPVESNPQIIANTVMAARWTGAERALPFILFLTPPEGDWDTPSAVWGARQLASAERTLFDILSRRSEQLELAREGKPLVGFNEGPWCRYCPGRDSCEAKIRMMRNVAELANVPATELGTLSDEQFAWWAERLSAAEGYLKKVRAIMKHRVDTVGPIVLGNGLEWGLKPDVGTQTSFNARIALPIVSEYIGEDEAWGLLTISKGAVEHAVKEKHAEQGIKRKVAPTMRAIFTEVAAAGGLEESERVEYGFYRPTLALPEVDDDNGEDDGV